MNKKVKRIIAWIAIGILLALYITSLVLALCGFSIYNGFFITSLIGTLVVPAFAWVIIWLYDRSVGKHAPGDPYNDNED